VRDGTACGRIDRSVRVLTAFVRLSRPLFLYGGFAGVALGAAVAARNGHRVEPSTYAWTQLLVTAFQLMVHYANDYFDRHGDRASERTAWSGGSGALVDGALQPRVALIAALACAATGAGVTAHFALAGNAAAAWTGVAIGLLSWAYSAPPLRLSSRGWGEVDAALVVAGLVPLAAYAGFGGGLDGPIARAAAAPFFAMIAMMLCVEMPDAGADLTAGKLTLVVRYGFARAWLLLAGLAATALFLNISTVIGLGTWAAGLAITPAAVAGAALLRQTLTDPRPASLAFGGVAFYAATVTGLAAAYALAAP